MKENKTKTIKQNKDSPLRADAAKQKYKTDFFSAIFWTKTKK